jgi:hypothetical protein
MKKCLRILFLNGFLMATSRYLAFNLAQFDKKKLISGDEDVTFLGEG